MSPYHSFILLLFYSYCCMGQDHLSLVNAILLFVLFFLSKGLGFFHSPSPRSLPLPSFINKKVQEGSVAMAVVDRGGFDDSATQHLRRLLRLG
ncbi:hypothetical protein L6452_38879 [Arctium lappa]|uniref:Uncharacterized protein n=1 Tax=Arctium lappa TaxID=4217 RepID=A0ACB8XR00_ARCLA|nr:hypothetical protein L6452_38879 [Arctium lappa]